MCGFVAYVDVPGLSCLGIFLSNVNLSRASVKVDILYAAHASNSEGSALLLRIISAKLLKYDDDKGNGKKDKRKKRYHISREGQRFLKAYDTVMELLPKAL